jgi:hypothetical protein
MLRSATVMDDVSDEMKVLPSGGIKICKKKIKRFSTICMAQDSVVCVWKRRWTSLELNFLDVVGGVWAFSFDLKRYILIIAFSSSFFEGCEQFFPCSEKDPDLLYVFTRSIKHSKNTLGSANHLTTTTSTTTRANCCHRFPPKLTCHCWWRPKYLSSWANKDPHPSAKFIAIEPLNWSEFSNTEHVTHISWTRVTTPWNLRPDDSTPSSTPLTILPLTRWTRRQLPYFYPRITPP